MLQTLGQEMNIVFGNEEIETELEKSVYIQEIFRRLDMHTGNNTVWKKRNTEQFRRPGF